MKRPEQDRDASGLEDFFAAARATPPCPSPALQARILTDAAALKPIGGAAAAASIWAALWRVLGGAPGLGGLATAACVGVWLGLAPPSALPDLAGQVFDSAAVLADADADDTATEFDVFGWDGDSEEG